MYLWDWFIELYNGESISYVEIQSWATLMHKQLKAFEVRMLKQMDVAYRRKTQEIEYE